MSYEPNPWRRLLNASWPLFRAFGVDVRVHWTTALVPILFCLVFSDLTGYLGGAAQLVGWALAWTLGLYVVVYTHEMGHIAAGRRLGQAYDRITLSALGGLAHSDMPMPSPRAEAIVALAGPATHLGWLALLGVPYLVLGLGDRPEPWAYMLGGFLWLQVVMTGFNLLPFYPMDGGRVFRAALSARMHPNRASLWASYLGLGGAVAIGLAGLVFTFHDAGIVSRAWAPLLLSVGISNFLACRQLQMAARHEASPYGGGDDSGESWKTGHVETWKPQDSEPAARAEERRERRVAEARRREERERRRLQERIDELLDRINEVGGVEHLTPAERRELAEKSELLRREPAEG